MARYVVELGYTVGDPARLAIRSAHREYLAALLSRGTLVSAGPWADDSGAMLIYETADEAEARAVLAEDPYTAAGVARLVSLREWNQVLPGR